MSDLNIAVYLNTISTVLDAKLFVAAVLQPPRLDLVIVAAVELQQQNPHGHHQQERNGQRKNCCFDAHLLVFPGLVR